MKRFLKLNAFALVALLFLGVADAWGLGIKKNVALNLTREGGNGSWDGSKLSWTDSTWNLYKFTDWGDGCDLSGYDKMVIDVQSASGNQAYRVVIAIDGAYPTGYIVGYGNDTCRRIINIHSMLRLAVEQVIMQMVHQLACGVFF